MQAALYNEIDYQKNDSTNYEMVYPFYSFDDRYNRADKAFVKAESYCVPASSWKGALQLERTVETMETEIDESEKKNSNIGKHFFCKDIMVKSDQIELRNLSVSKRERNKGAQIGSVFSESWGRNVEGQCKFSRGNFSERIRGELAENLSESE